MLNPFQKFSAREVLQGPEGYKKAVAHPGKYCVLPPLGNTTGVDAAIPLALNNSLYIDTAYS